MCVAASVAKGAPAFVPVPAEVATVVERVVGVAIVVAELAEVAGVDDAARTCLGGARSTWEIEEAKDVEGWRTKGDVFC